VHIGKKTVSSDVSGNYLIKRLPSGNAKIFVSCIGFQPVDTLVNIAFDQVFALLEKHSPATGSGHQTKVNTLNNLRKKIKGND
jgi:iron complex outermembrane receptor protein